MTIQNLVEERVSAAYERVRPSFQNFCGCNVCRGDVLVYALNRLPARYVATREGKVMTELALDSDQHRVDLEVILMEGFRKVATAPRCGRAREAPPPPDFRRAALMPRPSVLLVLAFGAGLATGLAHFWAPACVGLAVALAVSWARRSAAVILLAAAVAGLVTGMVARFRDQGACVRRLPAGVLELTVRLGEPVDSTGGLTTLRPVGAGCTGPLSGRWPPGSPSDAGFEWRVTGRWIPDSLGYRPRGVLLVRTAALVSADPGLAEALLTRLRATTRHLYGGRAPLVDALILNRRGDLPRELRDAYASAGLVHLLSISGFHVGLIAGWLFLLARMFRFGRHGAMLVAAVLSLGYVAFIGWPAPATRAAALILLVAWSHRRQRRVQPDALLAMTCLVVMLLDPWAVTSVGAWLSAAAMWGATRFSRWADVALGPRGGWRLLASSIGATLSTAPITALAMGTVAVVGIILNFVAIPLAAVAVPGVLASLVLGPVLPAVASAIAAGAGLGLSLMDTVARIGAWVPFGHMVREPGLAFALPWAGGLGMVAWAMGTRVRAAVAARRLALVVAGVSWGMASLVLSPGRRDKDSELTLHFLPVGQGDGAIIRTPGGHWVVVDAGPRSDHGDAGRSVMIPALRRLGARRLTAVVASHAHADHLGGMGSVLEAFEADVLLEPGDLFDDPLYLTFLDRVAARGVPYHLGRAGEHFEIDSVSFRILHPDTAWREWGEDLNEDSIVLLVRWRGFEALFMGDAGLRAEDWLRGRVGRVDLLKVGHHGSRTATGDRWLDELTPKAAVISVGPNRYGHPAPETLARLVGHGIPVWRTDRDREIRVSTDGTAMKICARSGCRAMDVVP